MEEKKKMRDQSIRTPYFNEYHKKHSDRVSVRIPKGSKDVWNSVASSRGKSLNSFIIECVEKEIKGGA